MKKSDFKLTEYQGGYSTFKSNYGDTFTGYHIPTSKLGAPTKPDTANQIQHVNMLLNQGIVPIEVGALQPEVFDQIPKQHFKEMNRMAKLTGAQLSVHAPLIEPSGFTQQGWSESDRKIAEKQLISTIKRTRDLDDKGGIPITIHSAGIPGSEYEITSQGKQMSKMVVVDRESGKMIPIEKEEKYYPGFTKEQLQKGELTDLKKELNVLNQSQWTDTLSNIIFYKENADRILNENYPLIADYLSKIDKKDIKPDELLPIRREALAHVQNVYSYLQKTQQALTGVFQKAWKYAPEKREALANASENFKKDLEKSGHNPKLQSEAIQNMLYSLSEIQPQLYIPIEDFALEQSSKTFSNVAFEAYKNYKKDKKTPPKICIENLYPGMAFSNSEDMQRLIESSRKEFVNKAVKEGLSKSEAEQKAKQIIGMTLDVGHLNIAKKSGFKDKDLVKEVEQIAKYVNHVHLTDNFGYGDSHLPPGMGNVPFKEILEELEKSGKGDVRKIIEAGGFVQHFGQSPYPTSIEALGSPIYSDGVGPYWNQSIGLYQGYSQGLGGTWLPQVNYETFGGGFSQLPVEHGGQRGGAGGSRMSGRPME